MEYDVWGSHRSRRQGLENRDKQLSSQVGACGGTKKAETAQHEEGSKQTDNSHEGELARKIRKICTLGANWKRRLIIDACERLFYLGDRCKQRTGIKESLIAFMNSSEQNEKQTPGSFINLGYGYGELRGTWPNLSWRYPAVKCEDWIMKIVYVFLLLFIPWHKSHFNHSLSFT